MKYDQLNNEKKCCRCGMYRYIYYRIIPISLAFSEKKKCGNLIGFEETVVFLISLVTCEDIYVICRLGGLGQHFQDRGNSFIPHGQT